MRGLLNPFSRDFNWRLAMPNSLFILQPAFILQYFFQGNVLEGLEYFS